MSLVEQKDGGEVEARGRREAGAECGVWSWGGGWERLLCDARGRGRGERGGAMRGGLRETYFGRGSGLRTGWRWRW